MRSFMTRGSVIPGQAGKQQPNSVAETARLHEIASKRIGGRGGTRTPDPLLAKQVLCQLSYTPTGSLSLTFSPYYAASPFRCNFVFLGPMGPSLELLDLRSTPLSTATRAASCCRKS